MDWLNRRLGTTFSEMDLVNIKNFTLIWSFFEHAYFDSNFKIQKLQVLMNDFNTFDLKIFQPQLNYFIDRYVQNGEFTSRFIRLNLRPRDKQELVEAVLLGNAQNPNDVIMAIIIIIFRFRNNLFHGLKDLGLMDQQSDNFKNANDFLIKFMDRY